MGYCAVETSRLLNRIKLLLEHNEPAPHELSRLGNELNNLAVVMKQRQLQEYRHYRAEKAGRKEKEQQAGQ